MAGVSIPYTQNPRTTDFDEELYSPKRGRPFLFQILAPGTDEPAYPVLLALHVNPHSIEERMAKGKSIVQTRGGFVEFVWPDELDGLSCSASTGGFIAPDIGLTAGSDKAGPLGSPSRRGTIAWERQQDLIELFRNNGMVYDSLGIPALRGRVMCMFDRGTYVGHFTTFQVQEDDEHPFSFELSWEFKVEYTIYKLPGVL